jgi:hypothetical protein
MKHTAKQAMGFLWGERTSPLHKAMVYAFSLDVRATSQGPCLTVARAATPSPAQPESYGVRHLFHESTVTMPEGVRCDVPTGFIESGSGQLGSLADPAACWFDLRLRSVIDEAKASLTFDAAGVVDFDGGIETFRSDKTKRLSGNAFLASVQESSTGAYRWIERRQLFGVGRVEGSRAPERESPSDEWSLVFSFDLYAAL